MVKNTLKQGREEGKGIEEHKASYPKQLELFLILEPEEKAYSNTIELYDFLPKYFVVNGRKKENTIPEAIERIFEFRGKLYELTINPAIIKTRAGSFIKCYPGDREEIIEDVLRKFACEQTFPFLDDIPSVKFAISQIRKHLKTINHNFSHAEIVEALKICFGTALHIRALDGSESYHTHMFQSLYLATKEETRAGGQPKSFVRLNELVARSIKRGSFRRINYTYLMSFKNSLARRLYKRLSHLYIYANFFEKDNSHSLLLSTILRDFGLTVYADIRNNVRVVKKAFEELKAKGVISEYAIEQANNPQIKGDVKFVVKSSYHFGSDMKAANHRYNVNQQKLAEIH